MRVGIWVPLRDEGRPGEPASWPLGRAVLRAQDLGIETVVGRPVSTGRFGGYALRADGWAAVEDCGVGACYDRFSAVRDRQVWERGLQAMVGLPLGNPPALNDLCRDKVRTQVVLEEAGLPMPARVDLENPGGSRGAVISDGRWLTDLPMEVFVKPRFGSFGEGVQVMALGEARATLLGQGRSLSGWVVQAAVPPPTGWAGVSLRVLAQRDPARGWIARTPVVRRSRLDPVVNAARGAELIPADDGLAAQARALAVRAARALHVAAPGAAVELGVDLVLDRDGRLWIIEVNGRPRGRLLALATAWPDRFMQEHVSACAQPLLTLAADAVAVAR